MLFSKIHFEFSHSNFNRNCRIYRKQIEGKSITATATITTQLNYKETKKQIKTETKTKWKEKKRIINNNIIHTKRYENLEINKKFFI